VICKESLIDCAMVEASTRKRMDPRISVALRLIEERYHDPGLSLGKMAGDLNLSISHLSRLFKENTGLGFRSYLRQIRMLRAEDLLISTFLSIKEVSAKVGYKYVSDFDHHFKEDHGRRPGEYRSFHRTAERGAALAASAKISNE
jgi:two-component system response regulator YesN